MTAICLNIWGTLRISRQIKPLFNFHNVLKKTIVLQFFNDNDFIKKWHEFKRGYGLHENSYFQCVQIIDSISKKWKFIIKKSYENAANLIIHGHHLIKGSRVINLDKLASTDKLASIFCILFFLSTFIYLFLAFLSFSYLTVFISNLSLV